MKILITVGTFFPRMDGVQAVTEYLALGLIKKGHQVTIVTSSVPGEPNTDTYKGIDIIRLDVYTKYALYFGNKKSYQQRIIELANGSDVMINVCTQNALTDYLYPVLEKIHCKKVLHMHGIYEFNWHKSDFNSVKSFAYKVWRDIRWNYLYRTRNFKKYDRIIQLNRFDTGYTYFLKNYNRKCDILENAADPAFADKDNFMKDDVYCICVANYIDRKNQEFILEAFYKASIKNVKMIFIGSRETGYLKYLIEKNKKLQNDYGLREVKFLTEIDRDDIIEYVKGASVYLLGSTWEAFSISLIESMAAGVPFISTDVGISKYLPGGIVVNNTDEMTYWIENMINNPEIRRLLGSIGHEYYNNHLTIDEKVDQFERIIKCNE